jgi:hypothetical protein
VLKLSRTPVELLVSACHHLFNPLVKVTWKVLPKQVEYFHPHDLEVRVEGMYPNITLDIQRVRSDKFLSFVETAWNHIHDSKRMGLTYPMKDPSEDSITEATLSKPEIRSRIQRHPSSCVMIPSTFSCGQSNDDDHTRLVSASNVGEEGVIHQETLPEETLEQLAKEKVIRCLIP